MKADLSRRTVTLLRGRRAVATFPAAIGTPSTPTPTGRFSVTDLVATGDPYGPFGWYAFGLSGHQPNLPAGWGGGDQLAIHGTNAPSSIGTAASAGCLRVSAGALSVLKARCGSARRSSSSPRRSRWGAAAAPADPSPRGAARPATAV